MPKSFQNDSVHRAKDIELQTWPSFVDILSSTVVVLCFALLILVVILSVSKQSASSSKEKKDEQGGSSALRIESTVISEFKAEFQKLAVIANPSLRKESEILDNDQTVENSDKVPEYNTTNYTIDSDSAFAEVGHSKKQILGEIPKFVDTKAMVVLKELLVVQKDVIDQQRKVIEQQEDKIEETVKEYQSLLSLVTKEKEVEDIRQKITPRDAQALFVELDKEGERVRGSSERPDGKGTYTLNPPNVTSKPITLKEENNVLIFTFNDNAQYLTESNLKIVKNALNLKSSTYKSNGVVLEVNVSNVPISKGEGQRMAVSRLLIFRSILRELGVEPGLIKLKTIKQGVSSDKEEDFGWISVEANK